MKTLKALSIRQPWANAILFGKDVENRSRYFSHRGPLLIHASQKLDREALVDPRIIALSGDDLLVGHLIGIVTVLDCVRESSSRWADAQSNWKILLSNARQLLHPVPYRGQLSLFNVSHRILRDVLPPGFDSEIAPGRLF